MSTIHHHAVNPRYVIWLYPLATLALFLAVWATYKTWSPQFRPYPNQSGVDSTFLTLLHQNNDIAQRNQDDLLYIKNLSIETQYLAKENKKEVQQNKKELERLKKRVEIITETAPGRYFPND